MRSFVAALILFLAVILPAAAQAGESVDLYTGPKTGTYYAIGKNIAQAAAKAGVHVDVKPSQGSIDNIKRINSADTLALGIVQSDVLGFLSRIKNKESTRITGSLRVVFPLYSEEVHVLARRTIRSFADLQGKKIAVGEEGSGSAVTAVNLLAMMNITTAENRKIPPTQAIVAVLKGDLDAMIFVGGKPVRLFKNLEDLSLPENQKYESMLDEVHFLPLDDPKMLEEYKPAEITQSDYGFVHQSVPTIAVQSLMVSDAAKDISKSRCEKLGRLAKAIRAALPALKEKGHQKWRQVNLNADTAPWKKDSCAWPPSAAKSESTGTKPHPGARPIAAQP